MRTLVLLLLSVTAYGVTDTVTIKDTSGSSGNRPVTISRIFQDGEIATCAQPVISGTPVSAYQVDVKSNYASTYLKHAMVTFTANVAANSTVVVSFQNSGTCNSGSGGLDKTGMLNFASGNWGADIEITADPVGATATQTINARTMLADAGLTLGDINSLKIRKWLDGPEVTQMIVEDRSSGRSYDTGFNCTATCTTTYASATWTTDATNHSLHPYFIITAYNGVSAMEVEWIIEDCWGTKLQDQRYSAVLKTGLALGTTAFTLSAVPHYAFQRWHKTFWSGTAPLSYILDLNLPYMIQSKALPNLDTSRPTTDFTTDVTSWNASDKCVPVGANYGLWTQYMPTSGGRPDIGLFPGWYVKYLYSMGTASQAAFESFYLGMADCGGNMPWFFRESGTGLTYDAGGNDAIGRTFSIYAHTTSNASRSGVTGIQPAYAPLVTLSASSGWTFDIAHHPNACWLPYITTGSYYYLDCSLTYTAVSIGEFYDDGNPGSNFGRHHTDGVIGFDYSTRGRAWTLRDVVYASYLAPDAMYEQAYFKLILDHNLAVSQGIGDITTGTYNGSTLWTWGLTSGIVTGAGSNPTHFPGSNPYTNPNNPNSGGDTCENGAAPGINYSGTFACGEDDSPWMVNYQNIVYGIWHELPGMAADQTLAAWVAGWFDGMIAANGFNPYLFAAYRWPNIQLLTNLPYSSWANQLSGFTAPFQAASDWPSAEGPPNAPDGYNWILIGGLSFFTNAHSTPWIWLVNANNANPGPSRWADEGNQGPQWLIMPRLSGIAAVTGGSSKVGGKAARF